MHRTAIVAPLLLTSLGALVLAEAALREPSVVRVPVPVPVPVRISAPPSPPPPRSSPPIGDFLASWGRALAAGANDAPHPLFLLDETELQSSHHDWKLPSIAKQLGRDLALVLAKGCEAPSGCTTEAEHARDAAQTLADADDAVDADPRVRRWTSDDDGMTLYHRRITTRRSAGALALDVTCECDSETVGMRMWNDLGTCDAVLREHGRELARYEPRVVLRSTKESVLEPLDAYVQTVLLAHRVLVIESGSTYNGGVDFAKLVDAPLVKTGPRSALRWSARE